MGNLWKGIPISRGGVDRRAITEAKHVLEEGRFLVIAPEGTRSGDGILRRGNPGVILFAANSEIPVFPAAHHGGEVFWKRFRSFRRTRFTVKIGKPFFVRTGDRKLGRDIRRAVADEIMCRIAELLPEEMKGYYAGLPENGYRYVFPL